MVSGRLVLQREYFSEHQNDVTLMYREDPNAHMIKAILEKSVVERVKNCVGIHDIRAMTIAYLHTIEQGGQLLHKGVPRPCHVCGHGEYQADSPSASTPLSMQFWIGHAHPIPKEVQLFVCDKCGHMELFRTAH